MASKTMMPCCGPLAFFPRTPWRRALPEQHRTTAHALRLVGKLAVITGGTSGIGERTTRLFVAHGACVVVVVVDIQDELDGGPDVASYVHCDVTVEADVSAAVDHAVSRFGSLDVIFNNAGIDGVPCHSIRESNKADFELLLAVNLVGLFLGTKQAARIMVPAGRGACIVGKSSVSSAVAGAASHAYTCVLVGLTENAAAELGRHAAADGLRGAGGEAFEQAMEAVANLKGRAPERGRHRHFRALPYQRPTTMRCSSAGTTCSSPPPPKFALHTPRFSNPLQP
ncbi:hypothetical protein ACP70R_000388 [Stipagrostis hirtigluma subsp. patula]